ncbi:MAG: hypothetical protein HC819_01455 [Cyclobacteriaceae bacterium]|nr:hypothetical protein [Cyclobacteriaceae bacterium]
MNWSMRFRSIFIYSVLLCLGMAAALIYDAYQAPNLPRLNLLDDANHYEKIYSYFRNEEAAYQVRYMFHSRVLIPFLASLLPGRSSDQNFFTINTIMAIASFMGLWYLFRFFHIRPLHAMLAMVFFAFHYVGPFRQNAISPINVDMTVYFFEILFLMLFLKKKYLWLLLVTPVAIAGKELFLALIIVFFCIALFWRIVFGHQRFALGWMVAILGVGLATQLLLNLSFPSDDPAKNAMLIMAFHVKEMLLHPAYIMRWMLSLFAAFGAFAFLLIKKPKEIWASITPYELPVHLLSLSMLALSFLGGMDYTRLIFLGFPFIMLSVLLLVKPTTIQLLPAFALSVLMTRFWKTLPEVKGDIGIYSAWMPEYADYIHMAYWTLAALLAFAFYRGSRAILNYRFSDGRTEQ